MNVFTRNKLVIFITALLICIYGFLLFYRLGAHPFVDFDESIYARIAQESIEQKSPLQFSYFGNPWYEKPPLALWLTSASFVVLGISEFSARLPIALAALATLMVSIWWVWRLTQSHWAIMSTAALYFLSFPFLTTPYFLNIDSVVGFWILITLYAFWEAQKNPRWYYVFGCALACGVLTKNIVGLFPLLPLALWVIWNRQWNILRTKQLWYSLGLAAVLIIPWHLYQTLVAGTVFWKNYLFYHVFSRFTKELETNGWPFRYFFDIVFWRYSYTFILFGGSVVYSMVIAFRKQSLRLPVLAFIIMFLILSASQTKLEAYIVITIPYLVMITGITVALLIEYLRQSWLQLVVMIVLIHTSVYTGWQFNTFKVTKGESAIEYNENKLVGFFLRDFHGELPIVTNDQNYKHLAIGLYAERPVQPTNAFIDLSQGTMVFRVSTEQVYLFPDFILIQR